MLKFIYSIKQILLSLGLWPLFVITNKIIKVSIVTVFSKLR